MKQEMFICGLLLAAAGGKEGGVTGNRKKDASMISRKNKKVRRNTTFEQIYPGGALGVEEGALTLRGEMKRWGDRFL